MVRRAGALVLGLAFNAAAASAVHAIGTPSREPLWSYGFDKAPAYDEPAPPPHTSLLSSGGVRPRASSRTISCEPGNPRIGWTAYVPVGSVAKGREIVTTGGVFRVGNEVVPKTTACSGCHGPDLMGMDDVPPLAGRSASYLARQLYDFQREARNGRSAPLMRVVVANLTEQDMVAITAYLASLPPVETSRPLTQPSGNATR